MFIGEVYRKRVYLLDSKCFIIAVCMVLCVPVVSIVMVFMFEVQSGAKEEKKGLSRTNVLAQVGELHSVAKTWKHVLFLFLSLFVWGFFAKILKNK